MEVKAVELALGAMIILLQLRVQDGIDYFLLLLHSLVVVEECFEIEVLVLVQDLRLLSF